MQRNPLNIDFEFTILSKEKIFLYKKAKPLLHLHVGNYLRNVIFLLNRVDFVHQVVYVACGVFNCWRHFNKRECNVKCAVGLSERT